MVRRLLVRLALLGFRHPWPILVSALALFAVCVQLTASRLTLKMDWTYLFQADDPIVLRVAEHRKEFPLPGDVVVLVDRGTPAERRAYLTQLAHRLEREPKLFQHIYYKLDLESLRSKALYYLSLEQLEDVALTLDRLQSSSESGAPAEALERELSRPNSPLWSPAVLGLANRLLDELDESIEMRGQQPPERLWRLLLPPAMLERLAVNPELLLASHGSLDATLDQGRIHYLSTKTPRDAGPAVGRLREHVQAVNRLHPDLRVRLTGLPVLLTDERQTCTDDSARSAIISLVGVLVLFIAGFGEWRRPLMAVGTLVVGLGWTMAFATVSVGHLNFITVTYISILMGLGIDFSIHLIFRYAEERQRGASSEGAIVLAMSGTGTDILVGAVAAAAAFAMLGVGGFRGVTDLGIIAGGGVLICFLSTVILVPPGLRLLDRFPLKVGAPLSGWPRQLQAGILRLSPLVLLAGLWVTAGCLWEAPKVGFDDNLLRMQAPELESIRTELDMVREKRSVMAATAIAPNLEEARALEKRFKKVPGVASVGSVTALLPPDIERKRPLVNRIVRGLKPLRLPQMSGEVRGLAPIVGLLEERLPALENELPTETQRQEVRRLRGHLDSLRLVLRERGPGVLEDGVVAVREGLARDLRLSVDFLKNLRTAPPGLQDLPEALRVRFFGVTGKVQMSVQAAGDLWEREPLEHFMARVEKVDNRMVGHPVVMGHITSVIRDTHRRAAAATLGAVLVVMLLYLRSPKTVLVALLPTGLSVLWMLGAMGYWGIQFNSANFVALPMVVGIGAVYGIHVLNRLNEDGHEMLLLTSTGRALVLSGLTTMVGFGSLLVAHHRGIQSLGFVVSVGVAANLLISLLLLPAAYHLRRRSTRNGPGE